MSLHRAPGTLLLALPLLLVSPTLELEFSPEEGEAVTVTYQMDHELELTGVETVMILNGEENEQDEAETPEVTRRTVETVQFTDEFLEVDDGRPTKVKRTFEELSYVQTEIRTDEDGDEIESVDEGKSELAEISVVFEWDDDEEEYTTTFADEDSELDEELLETLELTGHLCALLTDAELEEGDEWDLDVDVFHKMCAPGGDHSVVMESEAATEGDEENDEDEEYSEQFNDNLEGDIVAEFKETREEDGVEVAVIGLTVELSTEVELVQEITVNFDTDGEMEAGEGQIVRTHQVYYDLEGELLWNTETGRAFSFVLEGDAELELCEALTTEMGEFSLENRTTTTFEGTVKHLISFD